MNMYSDLKNIENTLNRIRAQREKLLNEAINIRKAIEFLEVAKKAIPAAIPSAIEAQQIAIETLEDAAAIIENELNSNAG